MKSTLTIAILFLLFLTRSHAQQVASYTQYMFNGLAINPAYAGSHEALSTSFLARFQNVGLKGAPNTQTLAIHSPLLNKRVALGLLVIHDQLGVIDQTGTHFSYAYRLPVFGGKGTLSMGLQGGVTFFRANYSELTLYNNPDPTFSSDIREVSPSFGAGLFYYTKYAYAGVSMPTMMDGVSQFQSVYQNKPVILTGGYVFTLNRMLKIKPNALLKFLAERPVEFDLNCNLLLDEVLWVGASYKSSNAVALLTQIQVTDQFQFGYSYQVQTGPINTVAVGSHELMLNYRFMYNKKGIVSPRYF